MKVLLATDGSNSAKDAAIFLRGLKFDENLELTLLSVSMHPALTVHGNIQNPEYEEQERDFVAQHHAELEELLSGKCRCLAKLHQMGHAPQEILDVSKRINADLIVVGAVGHSMISRLLLGSVSYSVATHAHCSVLVVRPAKERDDVQQLPSPKNITLAYDDSEPSREAVDQMMTMIWGRDVHVTIFSVATAADDLFKLPGASLRNMNEALVHLGKSGESRAKRVATSIPNTSAKIVTSGHAGEAIVGFAEDTESDMIFVGDSGHSGLHDFFMGSTTKYVLRHAPCSVWISRRSRATVKP